MEELDIKTLDIKEAFQLLTQEMNNPEIENPEEAQNTYAQARYGTKNGITFDLYDYLNGAMQIKLKTRKVHYAGITLPLQDFWTEIEERNILIKKWLEENLVTGGFTQTRGPT